MGKALNSFERLAERSELSVRAVFLHIAGRDGRGIVACSCEYLGSDDPMAAEYMSGKAVEACRHGLRANTQ